MTNHSGSRASDRKGSRSTSCLLTAGVLALAVPSLSEATELSVALRGAPPDGTLVFQIYDAAAAFGRFRDPTHEIVLSAQGDGEYAERTGAPSRSSSGRRPRPQPAQKTRHSGARGPVGRPQITRTAGSIRTRALALGSAFGCGLLVCTLPRSSAQQIAVVEQI